MLAPRSEVPRKSSPAYGASSQPLGSRRWSASALPSRAIIVRAAAIPAEYYSLASRLSSLLSGETSPPLMSNNDLAKVFTRFIVTEGPDDVVEREHTIDDWLKPFHGDGPFHGGELDR